MQVAGPAYGLLLDAWGEEFLAHGTIELKFVGAGDRRRDRRGHASSPATDDATIEVENVTSGRTVRRRTRADPHAATGAA